ncbi:MAG: S49 family peptidase [bacterium]
MNERTGIRVLHLLGLLCLVVALPVPVTSQTETDPIPLTNYHDESDFMPSTPGVTGGVVGALANPAAWALAGRREAAFWWDDREPGGNNFENRGFSVGRHLGFAHNRRLLALGEETYRLEDYQLGLAFGDRAGGFGLAYRWSSSELPSLPREDAVVLGVIARPNRWYSLGLSGQFSAESDAKLGVADVGIRPLGRDWLTIFADFSLADGQDLADGFWGAGAEIRPVPGLHLGVKFREVDGFGAEYRTTFHAGVTLNQLGLHFLPGYDEDGGQTHTTYLVHLSPTYPNLPVDIDLFEPDGRYVVVNLENKRLTYQKYRWFDDKRVAWLDLVQWLDIIRDSDEAAGVVLNLASFQTRPSLAWELRQKLLEIKATGKEIIIHIDRMGMTGYYLASVADHLTIDPLGGLGLMGVAMKRTYLKGTLEKLGIGVQELRYFTHKSAMEMFAREGMSEADREQRGRIVDVVYEMVRDGACETRGMTAAQFDAVVDEDAVLLASTALERGLVDGIARWDDIPVWLAEERNGGFLWSPSQSETVRHHPDEVWGLPPKIAVVFAVGGCDMDSGIQGRATSAYLRGLAKDPSVAAVVLRADSPGGDALPSDLVADAITTLREAGKPVIVSQGDVAASGGYWISMNGDKILTTPATITGSIGVIAGWFWDDGAGEKTGLTHDGVYRGKHAELFSGVRFPLLGVSLPTRPLDDEELDYIEKSILEMYDDFVARVAQGRGLDEAQVRRVGEGRVWMGGDAIQNGLVDGYGGLTDAIALAREMAGLKTDEEVRLVEFPPRPLLEFPGFGPQLPGLFSLLSPVTGWLGLTGKQPETSDLADLEEETEPDVELRYFRTLQQAAGSPVLLVPPDALPDEWLENR